MTETRPLPYPWDEALTALAAVLGQRLDQELSQW